MLRRVDSTKAILDLFLEYACGADMLRAMGVAKIRLVTNNPDKLAQLGRCGIEIVERVAARTFPTPFNRHYLLTK